jgi:putative phosphoesterase
MRVGILSDTHDNKAALARATEAVRAEGIETLFHCGDLTSPAMLPLLAGFQVHLARGNMDVASAISEAVTRTSPRTCYDRECHAVMARKQLVMLHGDNAARLSELIQSQQFDYVFHGHTHRRRDERIGRTRVINPGALGGLRLPGQARTICVLNLQSDESRSMKIG